MEQSTNNSLLNINDSKVDIIIPAITETPENTITINPVANPIIIPPVTSVIITSTIITKKEKRLDRIPEVRKFIADFNYVKNQKISTSLVILYDEYSEWMYKQELLAMGRNDFSRSLKSLGYEYYRPKGIEFRIIKKLIMNSNDVPIAVKNTVPPPNVALSDLPRLSFITDGGELVENYNAMMQWMHYLKYENEQLKNMVIQLREEVDELKQQNS